MREEGGGGVVDACRLKEPTRGRPHTHLVAGLGRVPLQERAAVAVVHARARKLPALQGNFRPAHHALLERLDGNVRGRRGECRERRGSLCGLHGGLQRREAGQIHGMLLPQSYYVLCISPEWAAEWAAMWAAEWAAEWAAWSVPRGEGVREKDGRRGKGSRKGVKKHQLPLSFP